MSNPEVDGGAGDDILTGTGGDDLLNGAGGDDRLIAGAGNDVLEGGDGNDTFLLAGNLTAADRIDGGAGNDTLALNGDYSAGVTFSAATVVNVERITVAPGHDYNLTLNDNTNTAGLTVDGGALGAGDSLTLNGSPETSSPLHAIAGAGDDRLIGGAGDDTLTGGAGNDALTGEAGNDTLNGGAGNDTLDGGAGNDTLLGEAGNDTLVAGTGDDTLSGGDGNDTFLMAGNLTAADKIYGGAGSDTVALNGDYSSGLAFTATTMVNVERITVAAGHSYDLTLNDNTNTAGLTVDGSALGSGDTLTVDGGAETASPLTALGGAGNDTLTGGAGNDTLTGGLGNDTLSGGAGNDYLDGGAGDNTLSGGANDDTLVAGSGIDVLSGGEGNDRIVMAGNLTAADRIDGGAGTDTVTLNGDYSAGVTFTATTMVNVERIALTAGHDYNLTLDDATNATGLTVDGGALGSGNALVLDGSAESSASLVAIGGAGNDTLTGGAGNDTLTGGGGDDTLNGGLGADQMNGGGGNDTYVVDSALDRVIEGANGGTDTVESAISFSLAALPNVENVTLTGTGNIDATGNALDNVLIGNLGVNTLSGGGGNDTITGGFGDTLLGGTGDDTLILTTAVQATVDGGAGIDALNLDAAISVDFESELAATTKNIEILDLRGSNVDQIVIDAASVDQMTAGNSTPLGDHTLVVNGDNGDQLDLDGAWTEDGPAAAPYGLTGSYIEYRGGDATLLVNENVTVTGNDLKIAIPTLADLDGSNGFHIVGTGGTGTLTGDAVGTGTDVNGDGYPDLLISAPRFGANYVVFSHAGGYPAEIDLATLNSGSSGTNGFEVDGPTSTGRQIDSAGDLNGDGYADFIMGNPISSPYGTAYVIYGAAGSFPADFNVNSLNGTNGFKIDGVSLGDKTGWDVASGGDINGDGYDDLVIGTYNASPNGVSEAGAAYVVFGHAGGFGTDLNLATLNGSNGFELTGTVQYETLGQSVASAGDVNGDGYDDLIIGAPDNGVNDAGSAFIVFGHADGFGSTVNVTPDGKNVVEIDGDEKLTGITVSAAGDINGDGFADVIVGGRDSYSTAVIFGHAGGFPTSIPIDGMTADEGVRFIGVPPAAQGTMSVSSAGDVNGDGLADLLIGFGTNSPNGSHYAGTAYVVFGQKEFDGPIDLSKLDPSTGFAINGLNAGDQVGYSVAAAGDINGDGYDDILVGAPGTQNYQGGGYVIFGGNFSGTAEHMSFGTSADDNLVGGASNDVMYGGGGNDSFEGGAGNDQIYVDGPQLLHLDGGAGNDDIAFLDSMGPTIDLTGALRDRISSIEDIEIGGPNNNTLKLDTEAVQALVGGEITAFGANTLMVSGAPGDTVEFTDEWIDHGVVGGVYDELTNGSLTVLVSPHVQIKLDAQPAEVAIPTISNLDGTNGFKIDGVNFSAAGTGDIDGDGYSDVAVMTTSRGDTGPIGYLVYGEADGFNGDVGLSPDGGKGGYTVINDTSSQTNSGTWVVASAGDVNGDGIDDFILGNFSTLTLQGLVGAAYVVFGSSSGLGSSVDLASINGANGFTVGGAATGDEIGFSVASAGDLNGDGYDDIVVGSYGTPNGLSYVVFGHAGPFTANMSISALDGTNGFIITGGNDGAPTGHSVASAGDINGDGYDDLIIGSRGPASAGNYGQGQSYILFGHAGGFGSSVDLDTMPSDTGLKINPVSIQDGTGIVVPSWTNVSSAGDLNGDGYDDFIVGVYAADRTAGGANSGASYIVFGHQNFINPPDLSHPDGTNVVEIDGAMPNDGNGWSVAGIGDLNGDGYADILISSHDVNGSNAGEAYVLYGHDGGFAADINLAFLSATDGFKIDSLGSQGFGMTVSAGGDVNGDGFADLVISDYSNSGETYVLFGGNITGSVLHLGTSGADTLTGTSVAETFVGGDGNDTIMGGGGKDSIEGGAGDDQIHVSDNTFAHIDGGSGTDTLHLDFAGTIDFGNLDGDPATSDRGKISNIETISVDNGQNNAMTLHLADVLDMHVQDHAVGGNPSLDNMLKIDGNAGDTLHLAASDGWSATADTSSLAGYAIYTDHAVKVAVETTIAVTVN